MKKQLLVVEDETVLRRSLVRSLYQDGFEVKDAWSSQQAWLVLNSSSIALLLLDIGLPDGNGLDFLAEVRICYPHLPVIMMTGQDNMELQLRAEQLGARVFVKKPFRLAVLRQLIQGITNPLEERERL